MLHKLKVWSEFMDDLWTEKKTFELRFNDRDFKVGDMLRLMEWDKEKEIFLDRMIVSRVTYILDNSAFDALKDGYVIMSHKIISKTPIKDVL